MTGKEFMNKIARAKDDFLQGFLQGFLDRLAEGKVSFCIIGGLGVNAYVEPVVSLDLDIVIALDRMDDILPKLKAAYHVEIFPNSINLSEKSSDLRIQIQRDIRYQPFVQRAIVKNVLGYSMPVATIEDILQGEIWAATDKEQRQSKRQKDLADILRLVEAKPDLSGRLPVALRKQLSL